MPPRRGGVNEPCQQRLLLDLTRIHPDHFPHVTVGILEARFVHEAVVRRLPRRLTSRRERLVDELVDLLRTALVVCDRNGETQYTPPAGALGRGIAWLFGDVTGTYDAATVEAVRGFQDKREIPVTGEVDQRTLDRLHAMTSQPTRNELLNIVP